MQNNFYFATTLQLELVSRGMVLPCAELSYLTTWIAAADLEVSHSKKI